MPDESVSTVERVRQAALDHGIELEAVTPDSPPETMDEAVSDLINAEYIARDTESGETARGESMNAAWANLRDLPKQEVHDKIARWHDE